MGNLSYRLGRTAPLKACEDTFGHRDPAVEGLSRLAKSLTGIGVDLNKTPFVLGESLELDPVIGEIRHTGSGDPSRLDQGRRLARGSYRAPYVMPTA
jgi:hypothetical protein